MDAQKTVNCNVVLGAPREWDASRHGECLGLPVERTMGMLHSYWKPTEVELAKLNAGALIRLTIFGEVHPPVGMDVPSLSKHENCK